MINQNTIHRILFNVPDFTKEFNFMLSLLIGYIDDFVLIHEYCNIERLMYCLEVQNMGSGSYISAYVLYDESLTHLLHNALNICLPISYQSLVTGIYCIYQVY